MGEGIGRSGEVNGDWNTCLKITPSGEPRNESKNRILGGTLGRQKRQKNRGLCAVRNPSGRLEGKASGSENVQIPVILAVDSAAYETAWGRLVESLIRPPGKSDFAAGT